MKSSYKSSSKTIQTICFSFLASKEKEEKGEGDYIRRSGTISSEVWIREKHKAADRFCAIWLF